MWGIFCSSIYLCSEVFSVGLFVGIANSCMYLVLASLFLSDGFLL